MIIKIEQSLIDERRKLSSEKAAIEKRIRDIDKSFPTANDIADIECIERGADISRFLPIKALNSFEKAKLKVDYNTSLTSIITNGNSDEVAKLTTYWRSGHVMPAGCSNRIS